MNDDFLNDVEDGVFLRPSFVATRLQIARSTIYALINAGVLPAVRVGKTLRLPAGPLKARLKQLSIEVEPGQDA